MKLQFTIFILFLCLQLPAQQFRYDNATYQTVYTDDLCKTLKENSAYTILDVRSYGEHYDTSSFKDYNLGYFKNSLHIPINELAKRWQELETLKDKPLFIYCSHSQRSRRASKMLADSGFTKVFNINGGMSRILLTRQQMGECFEDLYETKASYKLVSPAYIADKKKQNSWYIIDLREDSAFKGISQNEKKNSLGKFVNAKNVYSRDLEKNLSSIPTDKPVLLVDEYGSESPAAAEMLVNRGYKDVYVLFNGMNAWLEYALERNISPDYWKSQTSYGIFNVSTFDEMMKKDKDAIIVDMRESDQFRNESKNYWENIGHIKNAVNIPYKEMDSKTDMFPSSKDKPIILYTFSNQGDIYDAAKKLNQLGYKNVSVLFGGIWSMRWSAYNLKGKTHLRDWVVNIPAENQ